jgi:cytochrome c-type biogenesis protein CcmH
MTFGFWLLAALLIAAALGLLLRPLLGRGGARELELSRKLKALNEAKAAGVLGEAEYTEKLKLLAAEAPAPEAAQARTAAIALALLLPAFALALYFWIGNPSAIEVARTPPPAAGDAKSPHADPTGPEMQKAVDGLAERMRNQPDDLDGWLLLGRAYLAMQKFPEAKDAFQKAIKLAPDNVDVSVQYAEAIALSSPTRQIDAEGRGIIANALKKDPKNQRALWLSGIAAAQDERYPDAVKAWETLLAELPPDAEIAGTVRTQLEEARTRAGLPAGTPGLPTGSVPKAEAAAPAEGGTRITVRIDVAPELKNRVAAGAPLFVFARAVAGPPMPLAVKRMTAGELPATVELTDGMGMTPQMTLSSADQVIVGARISLTGSATPSTGDMQALSKPIASKGKASEVTLTIRDVLP